MFSRSERDQTSQYLLRPRAKLRNMLSHRLVLSLSILSLTILALAKPIRLLPNRFSSISRTDRFLSTHLPPRRRLHSQLLHSPPRDANIAYFLQLSESTAWHLPRLLHRIHHPNNVYAIHFDKKVDPAIVESVKTTIFSNHPIFQSNVFFMKPELITYRGVTMTLNTINAMKLLLDRPEPWDYFINISGSDYPLVSPEWQRKLLGPHINSRFNFLTYTPEYKWDINIRYRMQHFYVDEALNFADRASKVRQLKEKNPLAGDLSFQYTNAEAWMINSREFCQFVVNSNYARKMLLTFAFSVESSEHYFSTLLWNHDRFNRTIVSHALRHVIWNHEGRSSGQHPFYVDEKAEDGSFTFRESLTKSPNFFVRKFKNPESELMDFIDSRLDDTEHLTLVKNHINWATKTAIREHESKPALDAAADYD